MADLEFKVNIDKNTNTPLSQEKESLSWEQLFALCQQQAQTIEEFRVTIANLSETIANLTRKIYGTSREKLPILGQYDIFGNEFSDENAKSEEAAALPPDEVILPDPPEGKKKGKRSKRDDLFDGVETENKVIPVPEDEKTCPVCGGEMKSKGKEKVREEIEITPMKVKRIIYYREVFACPSCEEEYGDFAYAKAQIPPPLLDHSMATASAIAYLMEQRFVYSITYYRLEKQLESLGAPIGRETIANWINRSGLEILKPMADYLFQCQILRDILHGDETWCQVLHEKGKTPQSKSYIWLIVTGDDGLPPIVTYHYSPTRAHTTAEELLGDFSGYFHTDKYDGYNCLESHITRCLCWAHGRRKWYEAISSEIRDRDRTGLKVDELTPAETGFLYCEKLFAIERKLKGLTAEERKARRIQEEAPVIKSFWAWLDTVQPVSGSKLEKAVNYFKDSKEGFENYLKDGRCSLSNNLAENNARPYVVSRKNSLFHDTIMGAEACSIIYSIVLTAKANNLDIREYLEVLLQKMPDYKNEPEGIQKLLPWSPEIQAECQRAKIGKRTS